jgi:NAD(P)-dependent dehydrogenase (short-subunit alcohol dehydrogenase family)
MKILVTGANRGLGLCLTLLFLERGDTVFACRRRSSDGLKALGKKYPGHLKEIPMDVASESSVRTAARKVLKMTDSLDILVNNAAIYDARVENNEIGRVDLASALRTFRVNSLGPLAVSKYFFGSVLKSKGIIVDVSSEAGSIGQAGRDRTFGYCMSKAALNMQAKLLANHSRDKGIRVLAVHPGWLRTDMGGKEATLDPMESAAGILKLLDHPPAPGQTGLTDHMGSPMPW